MIFEAVGFRQRLYKYKGTCSKALWFDLFTGQAQGFAIVKAVPSGNGYEALRQFGDCHASQHAVTWLSNAVVFDQLECISNGPAVACTAAQTGRWF